MPTSPILGIVPARGSSKGILRKNLQLLGGKPLFLHAAETLRRVCDEVIVASDDKAILSLAALHGFRAMRRQVVPDDQTILELVREVLQGGWWAGGVLVLQPTCPNIPADILGLLTRRSVPTQMAYRATHLMWHAGRPLTEQVNRQTVTEWPYRTVGAYWWPDEVYRPADIFVVDELVDDFVDIDTWDDLQAARRKPKGILIEYAANREIGTGHIRRMLTLADALQGHDIVFTATDRTDDEWREAVNNAGYPFAWTPDEDAFDLVITDRLDTDRYYPKPWVTFEDRSSYAATADLVVNALYPMEGRHNEAGGADWVIVRPEFAYLPPYEVRSAAGRMGKVLVMFGGTDPSGLTAKAEFACLADYLDCTIVKPGENRPIPELMLTHDLLITSAGRTVYEANLVGIPAIVMAQNTREDQHSHLGLHNGNVYLGLGRLVSTTRLRETINTLLADVKLRTELSTAGRIDGKGLDRVVHRIEGILEGL